MCCFVGARPASWLARLFSRPAQVHVAKTRIYARRMDDRQLVVYAMNVTTPSEVAMVLPIPVVPRAAEDAVRFIDRSHDPRFFETLSGLFPIDVQSLPPRQSNSFAPQPLRRTLVVQAVGAFEASFVPTLGDFDRLDARFRLPVDLFTRVPAYDDYGFAVFRLAPGKSVDVHPMAFTFPTRSPDQLFFPTVHVHDGRVHASADFDHELYWPDAHAAATPGPAYRSEPLARPVADEHATRAFVLAARPEAAPLIEDGAWLRRRTLRGTLPNTDTWV